MQINYNLLECLERARQLCNLFSFNDVRDTVSDVDGNWLETWGDNKMIKYISATYYGFNKLLVIRTNIEGSDITFNNVTEELARYFVDELDPSLELYVIPLKKDGYKLSEFGLGK